MTTAQDQQSRALSTLRHLYSQMVRGLVKDSAQAKRIAEGLLSPAIQQIEQAARALPVRGVDPMLDTPAGMEPFGYVRRRSGKFYHEVEGLPAADFDAVYTAAQVLAMGRVPACPLPCGWDGLHKIAVADGAG